MKYEDAKTISLPHLLEQLGHHPIQGKGSAHKLWYKSPLRSGDNDPSFKVTLRAEGDLWNDFGTGKGGNIFEFVKEHIQDDDWGAIMAFLRPYTTLSTDINVTKEAYSKDTVSGITIDAIKPIAHPALIEYLFSRKIPLRVANMGLQTINETIIAPRTSKFIVHQKRSILQEVNYTLTKTSKMYFAMGFQNDKGGYELRNKYSKLAYSPKYFTTFRGQDQSTIEVFEGFFDFMSAIVIDGHKDSLPNDVLVLNSLSFIPRALEFIQSNNYQTIITWLDTKAEDARKLFSPLTFQVDHRHALYTDYDDLNDWLVNTNLKLSF